MKVNSAIILCAGMGNRMGAYGHFLPKPLWPFFQTCLLGLQVHYLKSLGIKNIFINLHHQRNLIQKYIEKTFPDINLLIEEEILDVGGGIQNFLNQDSIKSEEVVLAINSDIFINISVGDILEAAKDLVKESAYSSLFLKKVERRENEGYTEVIINEKSEITSLIKSSEVTNPFYNTYVGCCLINSKIIPKVSGPSRFFQTVADFKQNKVLSYQVENTFYDLGTLKRYNDTISSLWNKRESCSCELLTFLKKNNLLTMG